MTSKIVEIRGLSVSYNGNIVLEDVDLDVNKGDVLGIVGPNGGGKSTLLNAMLGSIPVDSGEVRLFGAELRSFKGHEKIGYVAQNAIQFDPLFPATVEEIVSLGVVSRRKLGRRLGVDDRKAVREAMELVGIEELRDRQIGRLSGGQKQRVFVAKALVRRPELLILDEATTGLDVCIQDRFAEVIRKLRREMDVTVVTVSHDLSSVICQADRLAVVNHRIYQTPITAGMDPSALLRQAYGEHFTFLLHHHGEHCRPSSEGCDAGGD